MQSSRRHDDYVKLSPSSKIRNQHKYEAVGGHDSYPVSRRDAVDRSPHMQHRSLSPRSKIDGSRRVLMREGRSGSIERRDYSWHLGARRTEKLHSGSPSFIPEHRKPHFDEGMVHRKYDYANDIDYDIGKTNRLKHVYGYDHHGVYSRMSKEKDYSDNRTLGIDGHVTMGQKSMPMEDVIMRGSHRVPPDFILTSDYGKTGDHLQLPLRRMDVSQLEHEKLRYQEPISPDKIPVREFYKEGENPVCFSRDESYTIKPASHSKGFGSTHFKHFPGTSSGVSRSEFLGSSREGMPLSASGDYPRNIMKFTEPININAYDESPGLEMRDLETGKRVMTGYPPGTYSPNRTEHDDFSYTKVNDDNVCPSADLHRMVRPRSWLDHDQAQADYEYRELSRASVMHSVLDKVDPMEDSYKNIRNSTVWEQNIHKWAATENLDTGRILYTPKNIREYMGSGYTQSEFGRRDSRDNEASYLGALQNHQISHLRSDYGFGRDAGPQFQKERLQDPDISEYDLEMHKISGKRARIDEELAIYDQPDKVPKSRYRVSRNQYAPQQYEAAYESGEEWIDENASVLHPSRTQRSDHTAFRKAKSTYVGQDHHGDFFASEDWLSSQDALAHSRKHSIRYYKPSVKYTKGHPKSGSLTWCHSNQTDKRTGAYRKHKTWRRNDEYNEDEQANDDDPSEDWVNMAESELSEDSDKFKQLVHEAFLEYSKKLNLNSAVRRRYKEQGKAGSLFCIVCRRSASKDFLDTQRLVTHAFMSHKVGLRARHLGLHKAICVLMGWNTYVPCDTTTWVPDVLSDEEAWAQKEDLMLWPPLVIIHNISMSNNNPEQQTVVPIEGVEGFLRGKGFVGGKIKVCLGKPADQSVMLVKFLGTFTGLGIAERLAKYFAENQRGREEFEQKTSNSSNSLEEGEHGGKLEERLLHGYIGIAEDLDKLDFNTKKWISLKSKKDIQDLENAPVKADDR
ncbi:uncharacterized protein LOC8275963 [Ricinus communis]|uniref:XS domain-containing protein n=1 Tax=Ricinus communis TaxID=3988 RepID=B9T197_RICCO|nr:uncharacterized protein LOC8275963 [Ricinus communis]EEF30372.1 hypothetical protein RCOM_0760530 [Ricinus communis]|eukprot:XP_002532017.1 uncharacterized protein LOC8275963 [Ricinus communis]